MQCNEVEPLLIDYIDLQLSPAARENVKQHLQSCPVCQHILEEYQQLFTAMETKKVEAPGPALKEKFDIMLQSELNIEATARIIKEDEGKKVIAMKKSSLFLRVAASVILVAAGVLVGTKIAQPTQQVNTTGSKEIGELKDEVKEMKEALMFNLLQDESASERIKAVNYVEQMNNPDTKVINALLSTMNQDKNVNVRLAALYSVAKFAGSQAVRDSLVTSLPRQKEPIMQIVLINILTEKKETKAIGPIKELILDKKTMQPVKDIAEKGLKLL